MINLNEVEKLLRDFRKNLPNQCYSESAYLSLNHSEVAKLVETTEDLLIALRNVKQLDLTKRIHSVPVCAFCKTQSVMADLGVPGIKPYPYCRPCKKELTSNGSYAVVEQGGISIDLSSSPSTKYTASEINKLIGRYGV